MAFKINGTTIINDSSQVVGAIAPSSISLADNAIINLGTGNDLQIYHNGTDSILNDVGTGNMIFKSNGLGFGFQSNTGEPIITGLINGAVQLYYDNSKKFETTTTGISCIGDILPDATNTRNIGSASLKYNTIYSTLFNGTALEAYYADLAEIYKTDVNYEPGTVVEFGGDEEVTQSTLEKSTKIAGVISTNPAYLMNSEAEGQPIALKGRVPCKFIGSAEAGDFVVSSNIPGVAQASKEWIGGAVIGKVIKADTNTELRLVEIVVGVM